MIIAALSSVFIFVNILFILSIFLKKNNIIDVNWGIGILISSWTLYILNVQVYKTINVNLICILFLIFIWSIRISIHIGSRFIKEKEEDFRYKAWREKWKYFYLRSYFQIYILQGFLMFVMSLSVFSVLKISNFQIENYFINIIFVIVGSLISFSGLIFETVADIQLKIFLKNIENSREKILKSGLWRHSRHPNYFGEICFWFGIFTISIPHLNILSIVPVSMILFLLLYISGIPKLEKRNEGKVEWENYKKVTPALIPKLCYKII